MLDEKRIGGRTFIAPNDYAAVHGEQFCGETPEGEGSYPNHCLHGGAEHLACCWCGDVFVGDGRHDVHGDNFHELTHREVEVVALMAEGLSDKLIGVRLGITAFTVHFHANNVIAKLGKTNRAGAAVEAVRKGIIP